MKAHLLVQLEYPDGGLTAPAPVTVDFTEPPVLEVNTSQNYSGPLHPGEKLWAAFKVDGEGGLAGCELSYTCTPPEMAVHFENGGATWTAPDVPGEIQLMLIYYVTREDGSQSGSVGVPVKVALKETAQHDQSE